VKFISAGLETADGFNLGRQVVHTASSNSWGTREVLQGVLGLGVCHGTNGPMEPNNSTVPNTSVALS